MALFIKVHAADGYTYSVNVDHIAFVRWGLKVATISFEGDLASLTIEEPPADLMKDIERLIGEAREDRP